MKYYIEHKITRTTPSELRGYFDLRTVYEMFANLSVPKAYKIKIWED
jgi:hypothetical protein